MEAEEGLGGRNERGRKQKKDGKDVSKSLLERGEEEGVFGGWKGKRGRGGGAEQRGGDEAAKNTQMFLNAANLHPNKWAGN